MGEFVDN